MDINLTPIVTHAKAFLRETKRRHFNRERYNKREDL